MIDFLKPRRPQSLLGLSLEGNRLEGIWLQRTNGSVQVRASLATTLSLNPLTNDPELVGREIRNHLEAANIRERRCAVCVPLNWTLTLLSKLPELPEADLANFLQMEAERGFPCDLDSLLICTSRFRSGGESFAMQVAIPRDHLTRLERVLRASRLVPVSFAPGILALQSPGVPEAEGALALSVGDSGVGLQVSSGGGVAALRALEGMYDSEGGEKRLQTALVARETRITLGQLPESVRAGLRRLRLFGPVEATRLLAEELPNRLGTLAVERVEQLPVEEIGLALPAGTPLSPALGLAARHLAGRGTGFQFLPPKISAWQQLTTRYSSRKLVHAAAAVGALSLVVAAFFGWQQWQLMQLRSQWADMAPKVREVDHLQQQIKRFRPWFDDSYRNMNILLRVTEAFPEEGAVAAKTLEIRNVNSVSCSGTARDNTALLKMLDQLRNTRGVADVKVDQIRGKSPMQFTFNFNWAEGGGE